MAALAWKRCSSESRSAEFAGIAAQGAQVRLPYCVCYSLENKMITELRAYFPIAALVNQLSGPANSSTVRVS